MVGVLSVRPILPDIRDNFAVDLCVGKPDHALLDSALQFHRAGSQAIETAQLFNGQIDDAEPG